MTLSPRAGAAALLLLSALAAQENVSGELTLRGQYRSVDYHGSNTYYEDEASRSLPAISGRFSLPLSGGHRINLGLELDNDPGLLWNARPSAEFAALLPRGSTAALRYTYGYTKDSTRPDSNSFLENQTQKSSTLELLSSLALSSRLTLNLQARAERRSYLRLESNTELRDSLIPAADAGLEYRPDRYNRLTLRLSSQMDYAAPPESAELSSFARDTFTCAAEATWNHSFLLGGENSLGVLADVYYPYPYPESRTLRYGLRQTALIELGFDHQLRLDNSLQRLDPGAAFLKNTDPGHSWTISAAPVLTLLLRPGLSADVLASALYERFDAASRSENTLRSLSAGLAPALKLPLGLSLSLRAQVQQDLYPDFAVPENSGVSVTTAIETNFGFVSTNISTNSAPPLPADRLNWQAEARAQWSRRGFPQCSYRLTWDMDSYRFADTAANPRYGNQYADRKRLRHDLSLLWNLSRRLTLQASGAVSTELSGEAGADNRELEAEGLVRYRF